MAWNSFCDAGAHTVGAALTSNTAMQELDLSHNRVGEVGALQLASGVKNNAGAFHRYIIPTIITARSAWKNTC
eukprot:COSAG05_NODE_2275_length_3297_cov_87.259225_3_plen_73_part_00